MVDASLSDRPNLDVVSIEVEPVQSFQWRMLEESSLVIEHSVWTVRGRGYSECDPIVDHSHFLCAEEYSFRCHGNISLYGTQSAEVVNQSVTIQIGIEKGSPFRQTTQELFP